MQPLRCHKHLRCGHRGRNHKNFHQSRLHGRSRSDQGLSMVSLHRGSIYHPTQMHRLMQLPIPLQPHLNEIELPEAFFVDGMPLELSSNSHPVKDRLCKCHRSLVDGYTENDLRTDAVHMRQHHRNCRLHLDLMRRAYPIAQRAHIYKGN